MSRSILTNYILFPLIAITFVVVWIGFSGSTTSPQVKQSTEPALLALNTQADIGHLQCDVPGPARAPRS